MPFPSLEYHGWHRYWTRERVVDGLQKAAAQIDGPLPCNDRAYNRLKAGHLDWPTYHRIGEFFHGMVNAWRAAGVDQRRLRVKYKKWDAGEDDYLLEAAGRDTLKAIADHLGRTYQGTRARLQKQLHTTARANQGFFSAAELAKEFNAPYHRVRGLLVVGLLPGTFDQVRTRWQVDVAALSTEQKDLLRAPKKTYTRRPPDVGDYLKRKGLGRKVVAGKVTYVLMVG